MAGNDSENTHQGQGTSSTENGGPVELSTGDGSNGNHDLVAAAGLRQPIKARGLRWLGAPKRAVLKAAANKQQAKLNKQNEDVQKKAAADAETKKKAEEAQEAKKKIDADENADKGAKKEANKALDAAEREAKKSGKALTTAGEKASKIESRFGKLSAAAAEGGGRSLLRKLGWIGAVGISAYDIVKGYQERGVAGAGVAAGDAAVTIGGAAVGAAVGGTIGGAVGALFGGVGAIPGAIAGEWIGGFVGGWAADKAVVPVVHNIERKNGINVPQDRTSDPAENGPGLLDTAWDKWARPGLLSVAPGLESYIPGPQTTAGARAAHPPTTGAKPPAPPPAAKPDDDKEPPEKNALLDTNNFGGPAGWSPDSPDLGPILIKALQHVKNPQGQDYIDAHDQAAPTDEQRALRNLQQYLKDNGYADHMPGLGVFHETFDDDQKKGTMGAPTRMAVQRWLHQTAGYTGPMDGSDLNTEARNALLTVLQNNPDAFQKAEPSTQQVIDNMGRHMASPAQAGGVDAARARYMADLKAGHSFSVAPGANGGPPVLVPNNPPQQGNTQQQPQTTTPGAMTSGAAPTPRNPGALRMENAMVPQITPEARALGKILGGNAVTVETRNGVEYAMIRAQGGSKGPISSPEQMRAMGGLLGDAGFDTSTIRTDIAQQAIAIPMNSITANKVDAVAGTRQDVALLLDMPGAGAIQQPTQLAADTSGTKVGLGKPAAANNSAFALHG